MTASDFSVSIILSYGIFEEQNIQYKTYIDEAIAIIKQQESHTIILCGGLTSKKTHISESRSLAHYLTTRYPDLQQAILCEERSITTPQNLKFAAEILRKDEKKPSQITIFCDSIRAPKVAILALTYFQTLFGAISEETIYLSLLEQSVKHKGDFSKQVTLSFRNITIHGLCLHRSPAETSRQIISSLEEIAALRFPKVDAEILSLRKKIGEI